MIQLVSFEIAKLLKEKKCDLNHEYMAFTYVVTEKYPEGELFLIPTIADVVMWLYEKHGIWIGVDCDCYGILWYANLSVASEKNWDNIDLRHEIISASKKFPNEHNSPTEAYESAIEYTLNNLI